MTKQQVIKRMIDIEIILWKEGWGTQKMINAVFKARTVIQKDNKAKSPNAD